MRFFTEKPNCAMPKEKWFAWYPVWAWYEYKDYRLQTSVWLEYVHRYKNENQDRWQHECIEK